MSPAPDELAGAAGLLERAGCVLAELRAAEHATDYPWTPWASLRHDRAIVRFEQRKRRSR